MTTMRIEYGGGNNFDALGDINKSELVLRAQAAEFAGDRTSFVSVKGVGLK